MSFSLSAAMSVSPLPVIQTQVVLDHTTLFGVWRVVRGLIHSHRLAAQIGAAGNLVIRFADRTPQPVLGSAELDGLRAAFDEAGIELVAPLHRPGADISAAHAELTALAPAEVDWILWLDPAAYPGPRAVTALVAAATSVEAAGAEARTIPFDARKPTDPGTATAPWFSFAATLIRRAAFDSVGGFAANVPEDGVAVDFSWRLRAAGWRLAYASGAAVFVDRPVQLDEDPPAILSPGTSLVLAHRFLDKSGERRLRETFQKSKRPTERDAAVAFAAQAASGLAPDTVANATGIATLTATGQLVSRY